MRALIVDDIPSMRHFLTMCLAEIPDLEIDQAGDGLSALRMATETQYALILLDVNLPLLDGLKVLAGIRQREEGAHIPVIVVTTSSESDMLVTIEEHGAHYMPKPVKAFELRDKVRKVLELSQPARAEVDRRKTPRLRYPVKVMFEHHNMVLDLVSDDISALGAFLISVDDVTVGDRGSARIQFPHMDQALVVDCRVVHVRTESHPDLPRGFGVRFEPKSPELSFELAKAFVFTDPK